MNDAATLRESAAILRHEADEIEAVAERLEGSPPVQPPTEAPERPDVSDNPRAAYFADTFLRREHCSTIAIGKGLASDPLVWLNGVAPLADADFEVAAGADVTFENVWAFRHVIVYGALRFAEGAYVTFDSVVVMPGGSLEVPEKFTGVFLSAEIDRARDPLLRSRGIISLGKLRIAGQHKAAYRPIVSALEAGQDQFEVGKPFARDDVEIDGAFTGSPIIKPKPHGWAVGDAVHLTADLAVDPDNAIHREEMRLIKAIVPLDNDHSLIVLDAPCAYSHKPEDRSHHLTRALAKMPKSHEEWYGKPLAVNFTRSCRFLNVNPDAPLSERGRFGIYAEDCEIENVELQRLGRTDIRYKDGTREFTTVLEIDIDPNDPAPNVIDRDPIVIDTGKLNINARVKAMPTIWSGKLGPVKDDIGGGSMGYGINVRVAAVEIVKALTANTVGAGYASTSEQEIGDLHQFFFGSIWGANTKGRDQQFKGGHPASGGGFIHGRALNVFEGIVSSQENSSGNGTRFQPHDGEPLIDPLKYADEAWEFLYTDEAKTGAIHTGNFATYIMASARGVEYHKGGAREDITCLNSDVSRVIGWGVEAPVVMEYNRHYAIPQAVSIAPKRGGVGIVVNRSHGIFITAPGLFGYDEPIKVHREDDTGADIDVRVINPEMTGPTGNDMTPAQTGLLPFEVIDAPDLFIRPHTIDDSIKAVRVTHDPRAEDISDLEVIATTAIGDVSSNFGIGRDGKISRWQLQQKAKQDGFLYRDPDTREWFTLFKTPAPNPLGEKFVLVELPLVFTQREVEQRIAPAIPNFGEGETVRAASLADAIANMPAPIGKSTIRKLRRLEPLEAIN